MYITIAVLYLTKTTNIKMLSCLKMVLVGPEVTSHLESPMKVRVGPAGLDEEFGREVALGRVHLPHSLERHTQVHGDLTRQTVQLITAVTVMTCLTVVRVLTVVTAVTTLMRVIVVMIAVKMVAVMTF